MTRKKTPKKKPSASDGDQRGAEQKEESEKSEPAREPVVNDNEVADDSDSSGHSKLSSSDSINIQTYEQIPLPQLLEQVVDSVTDHPEFAPFLVEAKELIETDDENQVCMGAKICQCLKLVFDVIDDEILVRGLVKPLTDSDVLRVVHSIPTKTPGYDPSLTDKQNQQLQTSKPKMPTRVMLLDAFVNPESGTSYLLDGTWNSTLQLCFEKMADSMETGIPTKNLLYTSFGGYLAQAAVSPYNGSNSSSFYRQIGSGGGGGGGGVAGRFGGNLFSSSAKTQTGNVHSNVGSTSSVARKLASAQLSPKEKLVGFNRLNDPLDAGLFDALDVLSKVSLGPVMSSTASVTSEVLMRAHRWHDAQEALVTVVNQLCSILSEIAPREQSSWAPHLQQSLAPGGPLYTDPEASGMNAYLPGTLDSPQLYQRIFSLWV